MKNGVIDRNGLIIITVILLLVLPKALNTLEDLKRESDPDELITGVITDVEYLEGGLLNTPVTRFTINGSRVILVKPWKSNVKINQTYTFYYRPGESNPYKIVEGDPK